MKIIYGTLLSLLVVCLATPVFACEANSVVTTSPDLDLNDFARILRSAQVTGCEQVAHDKLYEKLGTIATTSPSYWKGMRSGIALSSRSPRASPSGARGYLDDPLDDRPACGERIRGRRSAGQRICGLGGTLWKDGNTCFEELPSARPAAAGPLPTIALRAATGTTSGRSPTTCSRARSANREHASTIRRAESWSPTAALQRLAADLVAGVPGLDIVTLNHTVQILTYGLGQMTHIAAAFVGLEVAERPIDKNTISTTYKTWRTSCGARGRPRPRRTLRSRRTAASSTP